MTERTPSNEEGRESRTGRLCLCLCLWEADGRTDRRTDAMCVDPQTRMVCVIWREGAEAPCRARETGGKVGR
jgi:hypothetical protein